MKIIIEKECLFIEPDTIFKSIRVECHSDREKTICDEVGIYVQRRVSSAPHYNHYIGQYYSFLHDKFNSSANYDTAVKMIHESANGDKARALLTIRSKSENVGNIAKILLNFKDIEIVDEINS